MRMLSRLLALVLLLVPALGPPPVRAHEIGDTRITVETGQDTWDARIITAPTPLINRLELAAGQPPTQGLTPAMASQRLAMLAERLPGHLTVTFDGVPVPATLVVEQLQMADDPSLPSFVVLLATGPLPAGARTLAWRFDLVKSQHALLLNGRIHWIEGDQQSPPLPLHPGPPPTVWQTAGQYLSLGFIHIIPEGTDHVLFVLGLLLLTTRLRPLLIQVTSFTLAHCLTLGLALHGVIALSPAIVEPLIALSIAYVAVENMVARSLTPWRPALVFAFGLLHGLGFAGVLTELGLPEQNLGVALAAFNIGIEGGQLAVIALAYGLVLHWCKDRPWYRARVIRPASAAIALTGLYWTVERIIG